MKCDCDICLNFEYNNEIEDYECIINMDEDEYSQFLNNSYYKCPYFRMGNDYTILKKQ
ncbi:MAG: DUF6472 family protein [Clostridia bacterium]